MDEPDGGSPAIPEPPLDGPSCDVMHKVFTHSNDAIFIADPHEDRLVDANERACKMLGYTHEEILGLPMSAVHPREWGALEQFSERVFLHGEGRTDALTCTTKHGAVLPCEVSASVVEVDGRRRLISMVRDLTDRDASLRSYVDRLDNLRHVGGLVLAADSAEEVARSALASIRERVTIVRGSVSEFDHDRGETIIVAVLRGAEEDPLVAGTRMPMGDGDTIGRYRRGEPLIVEDIAALDEPTELQRSLLAHGVRSFVNVPLIADEQLIGSLNLGSAEPDGFAPQDVALAGDLANLIAIAIRQARLREHLGHKTAELERHVAELDQSIARLRRTDAQRRALLGRLRSAEELARADLAAMALNGPVQAMAAVGIRLGSLRRQLTDAAPTGALDRIEADVSAAVEQLRGLGRVLELPSLDTRALADVLRDYLGDTAGGLSWRVEDHTDRRPEPSVAAAAYRALQQLAAGIQAAGARELILTLATPDNRLELVVDHDAGAHLPPQPVTGAPVATVRGRLELAGGGLEEVATIDGPRWRLHGWLPLQA